MWDLFLHWTGQLVFFKSTFYFTFFTLFTIMLLHYEPTLGFINYALNNNDKSNYSSKCYQLTGQTSYY